MSLEYALFGLAVVLSVVCAAIWCIHAAAIVYGKYKFHHKAKRVTEKDALLPGVSVIKPLMGVDDNLMDNLDTFFTLDYPLYELLFCVTDPSDPVIAVVRHLIDKHPSVDAKLFCGGKLVGINPKINNMIQGYDAAKYPIMLISDAGLKMASDTLYDMVSLMDDRVGLVHQMPFTCDRAGFAGTLEKVYFGTCHSRMYLFINLLGINCVTGMSCLMRKTVIDELGGLKTFSNYIAEDFFLAQAFLDNKWLIQLAHQPAMQNSSVYSVPAWQKRMIRWCKLRLRLSPMAWFEPIQECFVLGLASSWAVSFLFGWNALVFFLIHVLAWFLADYMLLNIVQGAGRPLPFNKFEYVVAWLYRESICVYLFLKAACNPTVKWRNGKYRLKWGGLAEFVPDATHDADATTTTKDKSSSKLLKVPAAASAATALLAAVNVNENASAQNNNSNKQSLKSSLSDTGASQPTPQQQQQLTKALGVSSSSYSTGGNTNHKRTNSYSLMMNANNANNSSAVELRRPYDHNRNASDVESGSVSSRIVASSSRANLQAMSLNGSSSNVNININGTSTTPLKTSPTRANHQYHHSISNPFQYSQTFGAMAQPPPQQQQQQQQQQQPTLSGTISSSKLDPPTNYDTHGKAND